MALDDLLEKHAEIGEIMDDAEKVFALTAIPLAKKAARKSHELVGELLNYAAELDARVAKLEAALRK